MNEQGGRLKPVNDSKTESGGKMLKGKKKIAY